MLRGYAGLAQVDRYHAYNILADPARAAGPVILQTCMTHWRCKFQHLPDSRFRNEALARIGKLYAIEKGTLSRAVDRNVSVDYNHGDGSYRRSSDTEPTAGGGEVSSTLKSIHLYVRKRIGEDVALWGIAGYGTGTLTLADQ